MKPITITIKPADRRNEMHFEVQQRNRAQVFADRRRKKPKHRLREEERW